MAFLRSAVVMALLASVGAFAPNQVSPRAPTTALNAKEDMGRKVGTSFVAGVYLFANVVGTVAPAIAFDDSMMDFGSTQVLAAKKSGGRAGGRAASPSSYSRPPPVTNTRTIERTTVINQAPPTTVIAQPATVMVAPAAPMYDPTPGLALGLAMSAVNSIGNGMREYRQETEIMNTRNELQQSKIKEAELEARLRQLEMAPR